MTLYGLLLAWPITAWGQAPVLAPSTETAAQVESRFASMNEADRAFAFITALATSSVGYLEPVAADARLLSSGSAETRSVTEEELDRVSLAAQLIDQKAARFAELAPKTGLTLLDAGPEELFAWRARYRPADREKQLRAAELELNVLDRRAAAGPASLSGPEKLLDQTLKDYLAEFINAHTVIMELLQEFEEIAPSGPDAEKALRGLRGRVAQMSGDIVNLGREIRRLEVSLLMSHYEGGSEKSR